MKRQKYLLAGSAVFAFLTAVGGYRAYTSNCANECSALLMENVEALATQEQERPKTYSSMHFPCYKTIVYGETIVVQETGEYSATCFENENSSNQYCHSHSCSLCSFD